MDLQLKGKRALVAGASRGLGYAAARGLALESCRVAINSRNIDHVTEAAQNLTDETGSEVIPLTGNVADPATSEYLVNKTIEAFGGLDLLVTNSS
ncbi:MAG: SDR family NAD(P)-dependent oxidoreductase, partial [Anaerolineales bacterium]|nr:SDR family NAD(P)-dependent oxidoreductase [Anaerolineales bacterium]